MTKKSSVLVDRKSKAPSIDIKDPTRGGTSLNSFPSARTNRTRDPEIGAKKLSFSTFFNTSDTQRSNIPSNSNICSLTDLSDKRNISRKGDRSSSRGYEKQGQKKLQGIDLALKKNKKVEYYSFLELSDEKTEEEDISLQENLRRTAKTDNGGESYLTTLADDDTLSQFRDTRERQSTKECDDHGSGEKSSKMFNSIERDEMMEENIRLKRMLAEIQDKNRKWEAFGKMAMKLYRVVNKEGKDYKVQNEVDKKTIASLKEQVIFFIESFINFQIGFLPQSSS